MFLDRVFVERKTVEPEQLGPYRLERMLGKGGMGEVYLCRKNGSDRVYAIKLLNEQFTTDSIGFERFEREIKALQKFNHPNIVEIIDSGFDRFPYYVMEYIEGPTIGTLLVEQGTIAWPQSIDYAIQICRGLKNAHDHGVVHRDIKPANLLTDKEGTVKIADFGLAKSWGESDMTQTGQVLGTPFFMSPEQALGEPATVASDIYSLGAVLYTMLTGRPPFNSPSPLKVLRMITNQPLTPPSVYNTDVPAGLEAIVCELMGKRIGDRPKSAHSVCRKLERVHKGQEYPPPSENKTRLPDNCSKTQSMSQRTDTELSDPGDDSLVIEQSADVPRHQEGQCPACFYRFHSHGGITPCPKCGQRIYGVVPNAQARTSGTKVARDADFGPVLASFAPGPVNRLIHSQLFSMLACFAVIVVAIVGFWFGRSIWTDENLVNPPQRFWVYINDQSANPWDSSTGKALTLTLKDVQGNFSLIGSDAKSDPLNGDTSLDAALPILCIKKAEPIPDGRRRYQRWSGDQVKLSQPIKGNELTSWAKANEFITNELGEGWAMAELHDVKGGSNGWTYWERDRPD